MSEDKNTSFRFIIPIENLPERKSADGSIYSEIIQEFIGSNLKYAEVTLPTKSSATICAYLRRYVKQNEIKNIKVRYIHKRVYLERENKLTVTTLSKFEKPRIDIKEVKTGDNLEIEQRSVNERKYGLFRLTRDTRWFFPGYKLDFILETDIGEIRAKVTSAMVGTQIGDPDAGTYLSGGLRQWYRQHPEVIVGKRVSFQCIEPYKKYKLSVL